MLRLASHFKAEAAVLQAAAIEAWPQLAALTDADLRRLASSGRASEQRLIKLRGQARLVVQVGLEPEEAALLLYAGIADPRGLAAADPHQLHRSIGRLQRSLTGEAVPMVELATLRRWIERARQGSGRSSN